MEGVREKEECHLVGVHKGYESNSNLNICTLLTEEAVSQLKDWQEEWLVKMGAMFRVSNTEERKECLVNLEQKIDKLQKVKNQMQSQIDAMTQQL